MIHDFMASGVPLPLHFDINLDNDQRVYCFIGENGVGKTKLLESMAKSLLYSHTMFGSNRDDAQTYANLYAAPIVRDSIKSLVLRDLASNTKINQYKIELLNSINKFGYIKLEDIPALRNNSDLSIDEPVIFISARGRGYIGPANQSGNIQLPQTGLKNFIHVFQNSFNSMHGLDIKADNVTNWFLQRLIIDRNLVGGVEQLFASATCVLKCLKRFTNWSLLDENGIPNIRYADGKLLVDNIPIQYLSTGYASILRIIQEIVSGIEGWYFGEANIDFTESHALIFIDEIDLHLHPKWQIEIVGILKEFFPKATFYITTHSPLVLFNLKNGESYKLNKDEEDIVTADKIVQTNMHFLADIVKEFFDVKDIGVRRADRETMLKARKNFLKLMEENGVDDK